jgi:hypothetical protein
MQSYEKKDRVKDIDNELIRRQIEAWETRVGDGNDRGKEMISFITKGEQWKGSQTSDRYIQGKESLTFNICWKEMRKIKAQIKDIEFGLNAFPKNKEAAQNVQETNAFSLLMDNIILEKSVVRKLSETFEKCVDFGYAFGQVDFRRVSNNNLSLYPVYVDHKDPTMGFWDLNAYTKTKIDGKFAGIKRVLTYDDLRAKGYSKKTLSRCNATPKGNIVVDYWFRQVTTKEFVLLNTGEYKRRDKLTFEDKQNLMTRARLSMLRKSDESYEDCPLVKDGNVECIYFKRICNWVNLENPKQFPTETLLPLPYHPSCTHWTYDNPDFTIPFGYHLEGAQQLYNYLNSQIATQAKQCTGDKYFFGPEHVETDSQLEGARQINKREGGFAFGGDITKIRREKPSELSMSLIQMAQTMKQVVDEISGAQIDQQNAQNVVISGVAMDKITKNMQILNEEAFADHVIYVQDVGRIFAEMMPNVVTEQRTMVMKMKDGTGQPVIINEELGTGELGNDISNINNKFEIEVTASPAGDMEEENVVRMLGPLIQQNPQLLSQFGDIYFRNVKSKDSMELSLRILANIDPNLVKFSQGLMTQDEFAQAQQQQKQQQMQQQMQQQAMMAQNDPQYKSAVAMAQSEHEKAQAAQKNADTNRIKALGDIIADESDRNLRLAETLIKANKAQADHAVDTVHAQLAVNDQMVNKMREVIGDNDLALQGENEPGAPNAEGQNPDNQADVTTQSPEVPDNAS